MSTAAKSSLKTPIDYIVSDGYDVAQTAICFLYQFVGHTANEIYGNDKRGKEITIKLACYREVDRQAHRTYRSRSAHVRSNLRDPWAAPYSP